MSSRRTTATNESGPRMVALRRDTRCIGAGSHAPEADRAPEAGVGDLVTLRETLEFIEKGIEHRMLIKEIVLHFIQSKQVERAKAVLSKVGEGARDRDPGPMLTTLHDYLTQPQHQEAIHNAIGDAKQHLEAMLNAKSASGAVVEMVQWEADFAQKHPELYTKLLVMFVRFTLENWLVASNVRAQKRAEGLKRIIARLETNITLRR